MKASTGAWLAVLLCSPAVRADIDPLSGIDFVTIGAPGNAPWMGDGGPADTRIYGHGGVAYEYKIGRMEVTSAQWVEFFNAAYDRPSNDRLPHLIPPTIWGGISTTPTVPGGRRWTTTPQSALRPVGTIDWRMAAMYCNWLHNDKRTDRAAFLNGAYDVSTFGYFGTIFTDQATHHPDARYWIPTFDEWIKAAHYDPRKVNQDGSVGGWWRYSNSSDAPFAYGPPGERVGVDLFRNPIPDPNGPLATANAVWSQDGFPNGPNPFSIPLGAYPTVQSPWGLLDLAGATTEWTEGIRYVDNIPYRIIEGTHWRQPPPLNSQDNLGYRGVEFPSFSLTSYGFRIASSVPSPGPCVVGVWAVLLSHARRRRSTS
jgi:formylglycine-generating enzyme required for sulfatase activity